MEAEPKKISRFSGGLEAFKKARALSPSGRDDTNFEDKLYHRVR